MSTEITSVDLPSTARMGFVFGGVVGAVALLPLLFALAGARTPTEFVFEILFLVSASAFVGAFFGVVLAGAYNLVARRFGGIRVTLSE